MPVPTVFQGQLRLPVIGAPMFLVSLPALVVAQCKAGIAGSFPHVNARPSAQFDSWLAAIKLALKDAPEAAPFGVNLVVHGTNPRFEPDLEIVVQHQVPFVITSLGNPAPVVKAVHGYGGVVFCDVVNALHARKAAVAGVDGLICVGAGAGGHASQQSQFSLVREIREFWEGTLILGGAINDGWQLRAAECLGADLGYIGTRFLASAESAASAEYKRMVIESGFDQLIYTDKFSGIGCNFLKPSLDRYGLDPATMPPKRPDLSSLADSEGKLWRDVWTAGHGVATIHDAPPVAEIVERMAKEYAAACRLGPSTALRAVS